MAANNNGWISIDQLKPTGNGSYLTYSASSNWPTQVHEWDKSRNGWVHELDRAAGRGKLFRTWITHWQAVPFPPGEGL